MTSLNGFSQPVSLSVSRLPEGYEHSFSPDEVTPPPDGDVDSELTVTPPSETPTEIYPLTVSGT